MPTSDTETFTDSVASADPDRMAAVFFAKPEARPHLIALYAFNIELARIRDAVREPMAGHMRLAWWRDQFGRIETGLKPESPLGQALALAVQSHQLPIDMLIGMVDARAAELNECPFTDEAALVAHAHATASAVIKLGSRICGAGDSCDALAEPAGLAFALVGIVRALGYDAHHRHCFVPLKLLSGNGLVPEDVFSGDIARLRPVMREMVLMAERAVLQGRKHNFPRNAAAAILPTVLARQYIPLLLKADFDPYTAAPNLSRLTAVAALARGAWTGRV